MPLSYNPSNLNKAVDRSSELMIVPNAWGLFNQLGIFTPEYKTQKEILVPRIEWNESLIPDRNWDERNNASRGPSRSYVSAQIPHFPLDDAITANDIDGVVRFEDIFAGPELETVASTRARKMEQMRMNHAITLEYARAQLITTGTVYAPNGTLRQSYGDTINWYTEFGVTRTEIELDSLADQNLNPMSEMEQIIAGIQDGLQSGDVVSAFVGVASPSFFNALISNPYVVDSYKYYSQTQGSGVLNGRLTASAYGLDARYRTFDFGGILWIEYRGSFGNTPYIPANDAYVFPVGGAAMFRTYYAPANRLSTVNRTAQEAYWFEHYNDKDDFIEIMSESNFLNAALRPQAIVRVYFTPPAP